MIALATALLVLSPTVIYTDEDRKVRLEVMLPSQPNAPDAVRVVQYDPAGKQVRYRWHLHDDGRLGDHKAGDGIYSATAYFKQSAPKTIRLVVEQDSAAAEPVSATLTIRPRPSMLQLLGQLWHKLRTADLP